MARYADKHGLAPTNPEPWRKILTAGSDDKGGLFVARTYTATPADGGTAADFFAELRAGRTTLHGDGGSPLILSHSLYQTGFSFVKDKLFKGSAQATPALVEKMFARFMEGENPTEFSFQEKLNFLAQGIMSGKIFEMVKPATMSLWGELNAYFSQPSVKTALARRAWRSQSGAPS